MSIVSAYSFNLDLYPGRYREVIYCSAGDVGRVFSANLFYDGRTYAIPSNVTDITIRGTKPDGTVFEYDVDDYDINDNYVDFLITEQMAIVPGKVLCEIRLFAGEETIGSTNFILDVETAVYDPEAASESYIPSFEAAIEEAVESVNASAEEAEDAADRAEAAAESMAAYNTDRTPYLLRQSGGGVETGDREYDTIVGGTVAWNQLLDDDDYNYLGSGSVTKTGHRFDISSTGNTYFDFALSRKVTGHQYLITFAIQETSGATSPNIRVRLGSSGSYVDFPVPSSMARIAKFLTADSVESTVARFIFTIGGTYIFRDIQIFDLTQMFGSTIADYIYNLEQATAGAGVAWFRQFFPEDYYAYNAGELKSVSGVSAHVMRDADDNIVGNYPLDDSLTLRGLPKLDGSKLYYDGDTYEADGTVTRKYGKFVLDGTTPDGVVVASISYSNSVLVVRLTSSYDHVRGDNYSTYDALSDRFDQTHFADIASRGVRAFALQGNWDAIVLYDPALTSKDAWGTWLSNNPTAIVYQLRNSTTETADPFTNPQVVDPDGTEQYVTTSIVPVGHDTRYRVNLADKLEPILDAPTTDGTYTLTVTVSNGVATYSWASS